MKPQISLIKLSLIQLGGIVGAGAFALPAAFQSMGILSGSAVYWSMALTVLILHLLYAEIILARPDLMHARIPGQAGMLFGTTAKIFAYAIYPTKLIGAIAIYIILGGGFLHTLVTMVTGAGFGTGVFQMMFWAGGVITVLYGLAIIAKVESALATSLVFLFLLLIIFFIPHADGGVFSAFIFSTFSKIPFGIFIFALLGWPVISEIVEVSNFDAQKSRLAVTAGSLLSALLMWLFGIFAYAANTRSANLDPASLALSLPHGFGWTISAIGFLAIACAFVVNTEALQAMFVHDAKLSVKSSRIVALILPISVLLLVSKNFIDIIEFLGSYISTLNALLICAMAYIVLKNVEHTKTRWRLATPWICGSIFLAILFQKLFVL